MPETPSSHHSSLRKWSACGASAALKHFCGVLYWHRGGARWKLSSWTCSLLSLYALLLLGTTACCLVYNSSQLHDGWWVATYYLRFCHAAMSAAASLGYVYVAARASRPSQLHLHGLVLLVAQTILFLVVVSEALLSLKQCAASSATLIVPTALWSLQKTALFMLVRQKLIALGPQPSSRCMQAHNWGFALVIAAVLFTVAGSMFFTLGAIIILRHGLTCEDAFVALSEDAAGVELSVAEQVAFMIFAGIASLGAVGILIAGSGTLYAANKLRRRAVRKLVERRVRGEELAKVQRSLRQHELGMFLSIITLQLFIANVILDSMNLLGDGQESQESFIGTTVSTFDSIGDIAGILLLSGIGALFFREDPEAGDINNHIRSLLHSAVLTSRAEVLFEGQVGSAPRNSLCIVSFPGKFWGDWHALTWACEQGDLSSACVFLPQADTQQRFGKHAPRPETPGKCWCHSLYGERKSWGCLWWQVWQRNIELAVELELELVAVFFPGEAGKGILQWEDVSKADLWDGIGLGGSQKCEVAYLKMRGCRVIEEDLVTFRERLRRMNASDMVLASKPST